MKEGKKKEFSSNIMTSKRIQHQTINLKTSKVSQGRRARTKLHGECRTFPPNRGAAAAETSNNALNNHTNWGTAQGEGWAACKAQVGKDKGTL